MSQQPPEPPHSPIGEESPAIVGATSPADEQAGVRHPESSESEVEMAAMPRWVPILIGAVLVIMAALAVYTGVRYRDEGNTLVGLVQPRRGAKTVVPRNSASPPGEPEPGASLVFPGDQGDNAPVAHAPVTGRARAEITGGAGGISTTVRLWARRGMELSVTPPDAVVYVNDLAIGQANQFNSNDEIYDFPAPGSYVVRLSAPGFKDRSYVVTASENAAAEIAKIEVKLEPGQVNTN